MENTISLRARIETLEYLHDLLDNPAQEERRHNVRVMIDAYRVQEKKERRDTHISGQPTYHRSCS